MNCPPPGGKEEPGAAFPPPPDGVDQLDPPGPLQALDPSEPAAWRPGEAGAEGIAGVGAVGAAPPSGAAGPLGTAWPPMKPASGVPWTPEFCDSSGRPEAAGRAESPGRGFCCPPGPCDPGSGRGWLGLLTRPHQQGTTVVARGPGAALRPLLRLVRRPKSTVRAGERGERVHRERPSGPVNAPADGNGRVAPPCSSAVRGAAPRGRGRSTWPGGISRNFGTLRPYTP